MDNPISDSQFKILLDEKVEIVNKTFEDLLAEQTEIEPKLKQAMAYTLHAPGKRIRGAIVMWVCEIIKGELTNDAKIAAAAIEMVHAYSLVHDDLPAMDDDDMRRGQPSVHKKFDEATAILTGDALLTLAFEIIATHIDDSSLAVKLIGVLATVAGPAGMIAGQMADLLGESIENDIKLLEYIHHNKTAMMFSGATTMGALAGGAEKKQLHALSEYGIKLGLCFQISDDILDVCSTDEKLGKTAGKDAKQGKMTYPALQGLDGAKETAKKLTEEALCSLASFGKNANILRHLAIALLNRTR